MASTPDRVYAPAVSPEGHEEHNLIGNLAIAVFGDKVIPYGTYAPRGQREVLAREVVPTADEIQRKLQAIACYRTQIEHPSTRPWFYELLDMREWLGVTDANRPIIVTKHAIDAYRRRLRDEREDKELEEEIRDCVAAAIAAGLIFDRRPPGFVLYRPQVRQDGPRPALRAVRPGLELRLHPQAHDRRRRHRCDHSDQGRCPMTVVIDVGAARYGGDFSMERLIDQFNPTHLYAIDPNPALELARALRGDDHPPLPGRRVDSQRHRWVPGGRPQLLADG